MKLLKSGGITWWITIWSRPSANSPKYGLSRCCRHQVLRLVLSHAISSGFWWKKNLKKSNALRSSVRSSCGASALMSSTFSWTLRRRRSPNCSNGSVYRVSLNPLIIVSCVIFQMKIAYTPIFRQAQIPNSSQKKKGFGWWPHSPSDVISLGNLDVS